MYEVVVEGPEVDLLEKIKKTRSKDEDVIRVVEEMNEAGVKKLRGNEWKIERELVSKERKVYVPKDEELRVEVTQLHHDVLAAGHGGRWRKVEDSGIGNEELLVAGSNKGYKKVCGGM